MAVSRRLRYEILRRDNHTCRYCGAKAPDVPLTVDHVLPVALGGEDRPENLVTACAGCNAGKAASNPDAEIVANVNDDAIRWAAAVRKAAEVQAARLDEVDQYAEAFLAAWAQHWTEEASESEERMQLPSEWRETLRRFYSMGLETRQIELAVEATMAVEHIPEPRLFRYFCGVCWNVYRERQDIARDLYEAGE